MAIIFLFIFFSLTSASTVHNSDNVCSVYFKKEDLKKGMTVCPLFTPQTPIKPNSKEMEIVNSVCHRKGGHEEGKFKFCTSSYQDMAEKVTAKLGKNKVLTSDNVQMNRSTVTQFKKISAYGKAVVCHRIEPPPHVNFYCHQIRNSSVYELSMTAADHHQGIQRVAKKLAVCHEDTAKWNPKKLSFQLLKVKPGARICHLLPSYELAWLALA